MRPDGAAGGEDALEPAFGPDGHLDEGAAHAFADGALPDAEAARVVLHLSACDRCAALVAEARGLVAAASGVLRRLDDGPGAFAVRAATPAVGRAAAPSRPSVGGMPRAGVRAAAAALVVAAVGGSAYVASRRAEVRPAAFANDTTVTVGAAAGAAAPLSAQPDSAAPAAAAPTAPAPAAPPPLVALLRPPRPAPPTVRQRSAAAADSSAEGARTTGGALATAPAAAAPPGKIAEVEPTVRHRRTGDAVAPAAPTARAADAPRPALGVVVGEVRDANGRPIAAANVVVPGTQLATVTDSAGRFTLPGVPAGSATVRARRIGFFSDSATVAVGPADTARARLELSAAALSLNQVVVTGTGADASAPGPVRSDRRLRRTGHVSPILGCFAAGREPGRDRRAEPRERATPTVLRLAPGGVVLSFGTERGAWAGGGDSLVITWADSAARPLRLRREGDRWVGAAASLTPTADTTAGCGGP